MSLESVIQYLMRRTPKGGAIGEIYGTENFGLFIYSLIRMTRPNVAVELGVGCGATTCMIAQALVDNGIGKLWAIDNASDWEDQEIRRMFQQSLGYEDSLEAYEHFLNRIFSIHGIDCSIEYIEKELSPMDYYAPSSSIDLLFADATASDAEGCIDLLRYYLPKMNYYSSIFIDRASTINHSYLLLEYLIAEINRGRIPAHIIAELPYPDQKRIQALVRSCKFTLVHLTDSTPNKRNKSQNSRAWIKIEPIDFMPHNGVRSYF